MKPVGGTHILTLVKKLIIKIQNSKLCVKWKGYNNLFNSWVDKKDSISE